MPNRARDTAGETRRTLDGGPPTIGHAAVVGEPYLSLWPGLAAVAEHEGNLAFVDAQAWDSTQDPKRIAIPIPPKLADPRAQPLKVTPGSAVMRLDRPYPIIWPFEAPFDPSRM